VPASTSYAGGTAPPSTTAGLSVASSAVTEPSPGQSVDHTASTDELPLWIETKTAEGKVSSDRRVLTWWASRVELCPA